MIQEDRMYIELDRKVYEFFWLIWLILIDPLFLERGSSSFFWNLSDMLPDLLFLLSNALCRLLL